MHHLAIFIRYTPHVICHLRGHSRGPMQGIKFVQQTNTLIWSANARKMFVVQFENLRMPRLLKRMVTRVIDEALNPVIDPLGWILCYLHPFDRCW